MTIVNTADEAKQLNPQNLVTVYYIQDYEPANKLDNVAYVALEGGKTIHAEVQGLAGNLCDLVTATPAVSKGGRFLPHYIGEGANSIGMSVITLPDALILLGRKRMTAQAWALAETLLWSINNKSFS